MQQAGSIGQSRAGRALSTFRPARLTVRFVFLDLISECRYRGHKPLSDARDIWNGRPPMPGLNQSKTRRGARNAVRSPMAANMPHGMTEADHNDYRVCHVPTTSLTRSNYSLRTDGLVNEESITELADSIAASGIIEPIIVRPVDSCTFEVIAGERRVMAAKLLSLTEVPCIVRTCSHSDALMMSLTENLQRSDLNVI